MKLTMFQPLIKIKVAAKDKYKSQIAASSIRGNYHNTEHNQIKNRNVLVLVFNFNV